jgi:hypothetical protein
MSCGRCIGAVNTVMEKLCVCLCVEDRNTLFIIYLLRILV